jgi:beta-glucuronidase
MRARLLSLALLGAVLLAVPAHAAAAERPTGEKLYTDGYDDRLLLGGQWLLKEDRLDVGQQRHYERQRSTAGWRPITVPNAWNAGDDSNESMVGGVAYYRKDFILPGSPNAVWIVRFESVNYRATVYLNGKQIGEHTGAYLPWELPLRGVKRGVNRLVVRVDNVRQPFDFPPSGFNSTGQPVGGWWNYGGITREVYLRKVAGGVDYGAVQVRPIVNPGPPASARVEFNVDVHNWSGDAKTARVNATFGLQKVKLGAVRVGGGGTRTLSRTMELPNPHLWWPADPYLYPTHLSGTPGGYTLHIGVRSIDVTPDGRLLLNGQPTNFRGVGLHEDSLDRGSAIDNATRDRYIAEVKDLGATMIRTHYPLSPYLLEQADRNGILVWSEIPVYSLRSQYFAKRLVRHLAFEYVRENILDNQNHASIAIWSVGNELSSKPPAQVRSYLRGAAVTSRRLDPTRPVGLAIVGYPAAGCQRAYNRMQVIGVNEYFGWYPGPSGQVADEDLLSNYLDSVRACYPNKAIVVTEFGAEANRDGPAEEKGTYEFQDDFVNFHLNVFASKPWLSGAIYWTLEEFRVRPGWDGGNPKPSPPFHQKGLIKLDGTPKPAYAEVQNWYRGTQQYNVGAAVRGQ